MKPQYTFTCVSPVYEKQRRNFCGSGQQNRETKALVWNVRLYLHLLAQKASKKKNLKVNGANKRQKG